MNTIKVKDLLPDFEEFSNKIQVKRLKEKMLEVCDERLSYVADELLLLSEEILSQVSAFGVCLYLQNGGVLQTEKNNDFILQELFLHQGHQNAAPKTRSCRQWPTHGLPRHRPALVLWPQLLSSWRDIR